jgi:hypothetical protein
MNRYDLKLLDYGKPQLYGRAADTVQNCAGSSFDFCLANRPEKPHLNQDGIKRGGVAQARKFSD